MLGSGGRVVMSKIMVINVTHARKAVWGSFRTACLTSFEIESFSREHLKGNIYKGVVHRVQPGLEAGRDIGADRDRVSPPWTRSASQPHGPHASGQRNGSEGRRRPRITRW